MSRRAKTTICVEGWYYLFVVAFVLAGAILGEVNLLVALAGMLIGPLLFNWRFVTVMLRDVAVERQLPERLRAGEAMSVAVVVRNQRARLATWALLAEDRVEHAGEIARGDKLAVRVMLPHIRAGQSGAAGYRLLLSRRGRYRFGPVRISTRFPLGLVRCSRVVDEPQTVLVCPRLGHLTQRWLQMAVAQNAGSQSSGQDHGLLEGDYYGLREWRTGDSRRWIHWRTSAKHGQLAVRQFEQQRNRDVALVLDLWQPDSPTEQEQVHTEIAVSFLATAIVDICHRGDTRLAVSVAGQNTEHWSGTASTILAYEVLDSLAELLPGDGLQIYDVLDQVRQSCRPGVQTIVISTRGAPFLTTGDDWESEARSPGAEGAYGSVTWIDCRSELREKYFTMGESPTLE